MRACPLVVKMADVIKLGFLPFNKTLARFFILHTAGLAQSANSFRPLLLARKIYLTL